MMYIPSNWRFPLVSYVRFVCEWLAVVGSLLGLMLVGWVIVDWLLRLLVLPVRDLVVTLVVFFLLVGGVLSVLRVLIGRDDG